MSEFETNNEDEEAAPKSTFKKLRPFLIGALILLLIVCVLGVRMFVIIQKRGEDTTGVVETPVQIEPTAEIIEAEPEPLLPTPTSAPPPTATPIPAQVQISAPEAVPVGLPSFVEWTISLVDGSNVGVKITNVGNAMLESNDRRDVIIEQTLMTGSVVAGQEWVIKGVIDPNVDNGIFELTLTANGVSEAVPLEWSALDTPNVQYSTQTVWIDGSSDNPIPTSGDTPAASTNGTAVFDAVAYTVEYPDDWFVSAEFGVVTIVSNSDLLSADTSADGGAYMLLSSDGEVGDVSTMLDDLVGQESVVGSVVIDKKTVETMVKFDIAYVMFTGEDADAGPFEGVMAVVSDGGTAVIANGMSWDDTPVSSLLDILNSIAFQPGTLSQGN